MSENFASDIEKTKEVYRSLQEQLQFLFDSLARDKINLELQVIESKKFKLAVENASDSIVITDEDGLIISANKACEQNTGYPLAEIMGKKPGKVWGGRMPKDYYQKMWETIRDKKINFKGEINNVRKNGESYIAEINISSILDDQGKILFFIGIERDITKEKEISRMKNEFIGLASHQLRTPLTGIRWFTEILGRNQGGNLTPEQLDFVKQISQSNDRMIKLVNELLDISHIETGRKFEIIKKDFKLADLIKEALTENITLLNLYHLQVVNKIPENLVIFADYVKMKQIWMNLISNATKYGLEDRNITLDMIERADKQDVVFSVKDEGIGIPENQQGKLFEKFFRADNAFQQDPNGSGLGLYIAREIIRAHGGEMWFESSVGHGTTFFLSLPKKIN